MRFDMDILVMAIQHLNSTDFHKKLRRGFSTFLNEFTPINTRKNLKRNELIMIPIPKPKFFERKVPSGQSEDDYFDEITARQTHILRDAINRVNFT